MTALAKRQQDGRFARGASGNPGGRPKEISARVRELIRERTGDLEDVVTFLISVMTDPTARSADRIAAATALLDRAIGKPVAEIQLDAALTATASPSLPANWAAMPAVERSAWLDRFTATAALGDGT